MPFVLSVIFLFHSHFPVSVLQVLSPSRGIDVLVCLFVCLQCVPVAGLARTVRGAAPALITAHVNPSTAHVSVTLAGSAVTAHSVSILYYLTQCSFKHDQLVKLLLYQRFMSGSI